MELISRKDAKAAGLKYFYTGKECRREHLSKRFVSTGACTDCNNFLSAEYRKNHLDRVRANANKYTAANRGRARAYYLANRETVAKRAQVYSRWYRKTSNHVLLANKANYRAAKLNASPPWLDKSAIKAIYKGCPKGYHVDHIIPLQNNIVCGLHVPANLQYLSPFDNFSKNNRLLDKERGSSYGA